MASILNIPLELLVSISSYLPTSDLAALRQTCKHVETSLYEWFSVEFFTKKQFMLTQPSLQALIDISKHASLSKKLKHVIIATNLYDDRAQYFRDEDAAMRYFQGLEDQRSLLSTGFSQDMLIKAFRNLPHLETIGIRNFNASNRFRDYGSWSSWGATTVFRETDVHLQLLDRLASRSTLPADKAEFVSRIFSQLLFALAKANCKVSSFEALLRQRGLPDTALHIPDFLYPEVKHMLRNMSSLLLNVEFIARNGYYNGPAAHTVQSTALHRFLSRTPSLTHLRLNFVSSAAQDVDDFLEWLGQPIPSPGQQTTFSFFKAAPVPFHILKRLDLGQINTQHLELFIAIVTKFAPTLVDLNLWKISFINKPGQDRNLWREFIVWLFQIPGFNLTHLKLGMLQQDRHFVQFKQGDDENARKHKEVEYTGHEMGKFITGLIDQVFVCYPEPPVVVEDDSEDSDEEMEDDEDDEEDEEDDEDDDDEE